ncbi:MAG: hypothetical protein C6I01_02825 [Epsilonproteobacteria bacterium]|nr:hypothetical protein [Campylobacterota bacterium]NPA89590.1 hypothetical protein [Campylobacterota bacterium]
MGNMASVEQLKERIAQLKSGEADHVEFFREIISILQNIDAKEEDLKGVIPFLVNALNNLIKNIEKNS